MMKNGVITIYPHRYTLVGEKSHSGIPPGQAAETAAAIGENPLHPRSGQTVDKTHFVEAIRRKRGTTSAPHKDLATIPRESGIGRRSRPRGEGPGRPESTLDPALESPCGGCHQSDPRSGEHSRFPPKKTRNCSEKLETSPLRRPPLFTGQNRTGQLES